jgi:hypothetical protein
MDYTTYSCTLLHHRLFTWATIHTLIHQIGVKKWKLLGTSYLGKPIRMLTIGTGPVKIMVWSQMHGDEPTATAAIFDVINFLNTHTDHNQILRNTILTNCTLYFIPVINPDGLEAYTRQNAQNIDINRDYIAQQSPEGILLKQLRNNLKPDFCFNMHDQSTLYCTPNKKAVAMAFLAPPIDTSRQINWVRAQAMKVIVCITDELQKHIPQHIARFNDTFEPRAFGDNFQQLGSATILIESGGWLNDDERQIIRKYNFIALLTAFEVIANKCYQNKDIINYLLLPENQKNIFHILFKNIEIKSKQGNYWLDIGINYTEEYDAQNRTLSKKWYVQDAGDLSIYTAYQIIETNKLYTNTPITLTHLTNLQLFNTNNELVYSWHKGILKLPLTS